ncbi:hypothetical protein SAMN05192575_103406 [Nocardioides alpinus]|uniref:Uncharacterized protein n=1 Tax=Nocardioides alpinus TaxID=748909 RepID=A0A1I0YEN6_9ACTN|nr:hypothetical protein [Nocardioides alpinus]PKH38923.1 hypothetical protein CXG46_14375 [Nocardioides alpinus]SFB10653.1 hypothetical protein SAMN05192575_103406 [Nocardioides alpinus]
MWKVLTRTWRNRLLVGVVITAVSYGLAVLLRLGPQPVPFAVAMAVVLSLMWLALDLVEEEPVAWVPAMPRTSDRVDEATNDLRILTSHQQASSPSEAVRDRLVALARARDVELAETLHHELDAVRRLSPAEIDRILTRIEEARDRS